MIVGEATIDIAAPPRDVLEFVLDLERYRQADYKIGKVVAASRNGNEGTVKFRGVLRGLSAPAAPFTWRLEPWTRLEFRSAPGLIARFGLDFEGSFRCEEIDGGTRVTHREQFRFRSPLKWIVEPYVGSWLAADTPAEMVRVKAMLEQ